MLTFSDQEYKWCPECNGNIRKDAYYCKFCHKPIGSKLLKTKQADGVAQLITKAARWLPDFNSVLRAIPTPLRDRIDEADRNTPAPYIGLPPGVDPEECRNAERNCDLCAPHPPSSAEFGIIVDILIGLHANGQPIAALCADRRLQLIELTTGEVVAEFELRVAEIQGGQKCRHCAEFRAVDEPVCRYCGGTEDSPPNPIDYRIQLLAEFEHYDPTLLRNVLLWEAAKRRIENEPPVEEETLQAHNIGEADIDRQILTLRQNPNRLPRSRWRERMFQLGIEPGYYESTAFPIMGYTCDFDYFQLTDIDSLGRAMTPDFSCKAHDNAGAALFVFDHLLSRWQNNPHFSRNKHSILSGKSMVYLHLKDDENHKRFEKEAKEAQLESVPEEFRAAMEFALDTTDDSMDFKALLEMDPELRLQSIERLGEQSAKKQSQLAERMDTLIPGLTDAFAGMLELTSVSMQITKLLLQGQIALKKADSVTACRQFESALALGDNSIQDVSRRCNVLLELANAQFVG